MVSDHTNQWIIVVNHIKFCTVELPVEEGKLLILKKLVYICILSTQANHYGNLF